VLAAAKCPKELFRAREEQAGHGVVLNVKDATGGAHDVLSHLWVASISSTSYECQEKRGVEPISTKQLNKHLG